MAGVKSSTINISSLPLTFTLSTSSAGRVTSQEVEVVSIGASFALDSVNAANSGEIGLGRGSLEDLLVGELLSYWIFPVGVDVHIVWSW